MKHILLTPKRERLFQLNAIDPAFQKYKSTVSKQLAAYQDPFAQPILIYSNIQNGLGVFNGNTVRSKKIKFK